MLAVMNFHRHLVDVRLESFRRVRQSGQRERHGRTSKEKFAWEKRRCRQGTEDREGDARHPLNAGGAVEWLWKIAYGFSTTNLKSESNGAGEKQHESRCRAEC